MALKKEESARLRIETYNDGSVASLGESYRLEYGEKLTTCQAS